MAEVAEKNTETEDRIRPRFRAKQRLARISPQKLRLVADMIRGKDYNTAISILKACPRRGAVYCRKVLESAMGNATKIIDNPENLKKKRDEYPPDALREVDVDALHVVEIRVDGGPVMKRWRPSSATSISKPPSGPVVWSIRMAPGPTAGSSRAPGTPRP